MLVKSARRYINTLNKILKNQHNDIITEIVEDDDMDVFSVTLKFHIEGLYCFIAAFNNDDNVLYYVEGKGRAITYIISDNETQTESMHTILNRIYDIVARLTAEIEELDEIEEIEELDEYEEVEQNADSSSGNDLFDGCNTVKDIEKVCGCCSHFNACKQGYQTDASTCCMFDNLYKSRSNPEWHHVSLDTLANLDFDMIDEKRQRYLTVYREMQETIVNLRKCKTESSYNNCIYRYMVRLNNMYAQGKFSNAMLDYIQAKLSMQNVESGIWSSEYEKATGYHESRRYNKSRAGR